MTTVSAAVTGCEAGGLGPHELTGRVHDGFAAQDWDSSVDLGDLIEVQVETGFRVGHRSLLLP